MRRVRPDELMRAWLETLSRSEDESVAALASCALDLHQVLGSSRAVPDCAAAVRYVTLVECLMSSAAARSRTAGDLGESAASPVDTGASGDLERF